MAGHGAETIRASYSEAAFTMVEQNQQLGTGHAVQCALAEFRDQAKVVILYGDVPLISPTTIANMLSRMNSI